MPTPFALEILPDRPALVERARQLLCDRIAACLNQQASCSIALSGGSTPKPLYAALAQTALPWERLKIVWGDERYVPADHPDSNQRMAREAWLNHVPIPEENILAIATDISDPAIAAEHYEQRLHTAIGTPDTHPPIIDIVLLGMGDDGHTASLFPHTTALGEQQRAVTVGNKGDSLRITLTYPVLNAARHTLFLVAGADKRSALNHVLPHGQLSSPDPTLDSQYPSRGVRPHGELRWLLDQAAGANLTPTA
jgi:6-phosphogluconolactonase